MTTRYRIIILPEAQQDIRDIILYIAGELGAPDAALNLQDSFEEALKSLTEMPERIKTIDEQPWKDLGVRKIRVENYYIYFIISTAEHTVKIMAVIYTGRDQKRQMTERKMDEL